MSVRFLNEKLNSFSKIGCILTVCGSVIIIIHAPKESEINSLNDFVRRIGTSGRTKLFPYEIHKIFL